MKWLKSYGNYLHVKSKSPVTYARFNAYYRDIFDGGIMAWTISRIMVWSIWRINKLKGIIWAVKRTHMSVDICELSRKVRHCEHSLSDCPAVFPMDKGAAFLYILAHSWGHVLIINQLTIPSHQQFIKCMFLAQSHAVLPCGVCLLSICHCWHLNTSHFTTSDIDTLADSAECPSRPCPAP